MELTNLEEKRREAGTEGPQAGAKLSQVIQIDEERFRNGWRKSYATGWKRR
jgi:hypothetical protein